MKAHRTDSTPDMSLPPRRRRKLFTSGEEASFILIVLVPTVAAFLAIRLMPIGVTFFGSFFKWNLVDGLGKLVLLKNYAALFGDKVFYASFLNTMSFTVFTTFFSVALGLLFAWLTNRGMPLYSVYETVIFIPVVLTFVPVCLIWLWLFDWDNGFINMTLKGFGLHRISWLSTPEMSMVSVIIVSIWKVIGYNMIIFSVGLKNIPRSYYEAADMDGAGALAVFRRVTLPLLKPITLFVMVISVINNLKVFTQVYVMTHGKQGGGAQVDVLVSDIYTRSFVYYDMGAASAESILLLLVVLIMTVVQFRIAREDERGAG